MEGETKERRKELRKIKWLLLADKREREEERLNRERDAAERKARKTTSVQER